MNVKNEFTVVNMIHCIAIPAVNLYTLEKRFMYTLV